jgi:hypothetical protein
LKNDNAPAAENVSFMPLEDFSRAQAAYFSLSSEREGDNDTFSGFPPLQLHAGSRYNNIWQNCHFRTVLCKKTSTCYASLKSSTINLPLFSL